MHSHELIPRTKSDVATARRTVALGYPAVAPVLGELLEWLQDYNWPVAKVLAPFLRDIGAPLIPHLDRGLLSRDETWKYWLIECVISGNPELFAHYLPQLLRIAQAPTSLEQQNELQEVARQALLSRGHTWE